MSTAFCATSVKITLVLPLGSFGWQSMMVSCLASTATATHRRVQSYLGAVPGVDCTRRGGVVGVPGVCVG
jgi:hypothetical protein